LQRLGLILNASSNRNIIVKVECTPRIGETVVDENLKPVGDVFDLLGPVSSPYAAIRPATPTPKNLVNKTVYVVPSKRRKEKKRHG
jgi:rRNA processing protein Gar1